MEPTLAAQIFAALTALVVLFQVALAAGAPWGHLTWGGRFPGRLPARMRGVAVFSAVLLTLFALVVAARAGLFLPELRPASRGLVWVVVAYTALGVVANAATPSPWERVLWLPVVLGLSACALVVALS